MKVKCVAITVLGMICAFLAADVLFGQKPSDIRYGNSQGSSIAFRHSLHGENIGLDCAHCHTGSRSDAHAYLPSKSDCMDCHRLPLTESPAIETLDSALEKSPSEPWMKQSALPDHVVFHHGVHSAAGVECSDCHGNREKNDIYGGEKFDMNMCLTCHREGALGERKFKPAATYCGACHR